MKTLRDPSTPRGAVQPAPHAAPAPLPPSEDQRFFDESLRASMRSLGRLIQNRRKANG
ncbi:hypothetical protein [Longimicrobium sp.]|uniref:hypothetical protein n=1 Tax=Longimicrobium sp. TaxID=2029185 RepID=UPI002E335D27|nr:hypothetical protein [Longimicrobium sp.]HEX6042592.1 hypothetical protein [Longimicrobium sp.]